MTMTVEDFCALLIRSRLHAVDAVKAIYNRWQAVAIEPDNLAMFQDWLVGRQHLTDYQRTLLSGGHTDNFFLNEYKLLERVGKGRMAGVYKALDPKGRVVAIKILPPSRAQDKEIWSRFQRETRMAMQLNHPSIVRTFDYGKVKTIHFLVMEYLHGATLQEVLDERKRLSPKEAVRIAFLTTLGLHHIYQRKLVHRDMKPGNLMLCPAPASQENSLRSMVKIMDIGLGRPVYNPANQKKDELTNEGAILGTPDYLAPEQARDARKADIRSDLYSLGCVLYHAVTGTPPFADENMVWQLMRHAKEAPRPLKELAPEASDELNQIVQTMLAKDPAKRYQTPTHAAEAMKRFLATKA
jgi:eukaryotic-like serine/threonine-protein kinase